MNENDAPVPDVADTIRTLNKLTGSPTNSTKRYCIIKAGDALSVKAEQVNGTLQWIITTRTVPSGVFYVLDATQVWPDLWTTLLESEERLGT